MATQRTLQARTANHTFEELIKHDKATRSMHDEAQLERRSQGKPGFWAHMPLLMSK